MNEEDLKNNGEETFSYKYVALTEEERRVIEDIRVRYEGRTDREAGFERLRKLDRLVRRTAFAVSVAVGVVGLLLFGGGMSLSLETSSAVLLALGVALSAAGVAVMAVAKPVHSKLSERLKKKYGAEILKLSEELLGKDGDR